MQPTIDIMNSEDSKNEPTGMKVCKSNSKTLKTMPDLKAKKSPVKVINLNKKFSKYKAKPKKVVKTKAKVYHKMVNKLRDYEVKQSSLASPINGLSSARGLPISDEPILEDHVRPMS